MNKMSKFINTKKMTTETTHDTSPIKKRYSKIAQNYHLQTQKTNCSKNKNMSHTPKFKTLKRYLSQRNIERSDKEFENPVIQLLQKTKFDDLQEQDRRITLPILNKVQSTVQIEKPSSKLFLKKKGESHTTVVSPKQNQIFLKEEEIIYKALELKDTTSTSSAELAPKPQTFIPSFLRLKKNEKKKYSIQQKSNYHKIKQLGRGKFGEVFLVKDIKTNFIMAMKVFDKERILKNNLLQQFVRELKIQTFLNHSSIIKMYGFFCDQRNFYVLLELGCDGQLYSLLEKKISLSQEATSYILCSLLQALSYIHKHKIIHRDIKPENIVLIHGFPKICDFGWAVHNTNDFRDTYCGTPLYFSPELLSRNFYDSKIDIWAIGVLAYELRLGTSPFDIESQQDLHKIITDSVKFPMKGTSCKFREFIQAILKKNPSQRVTCQQLLKYQFITQYQGLQACQQLI